MTGPRPGAKMTAVPAAAPEVLGGLAFETLLADRQRHGFRKIWWSIVWKCNRHLVDVIDLFLNPACFGYGLIIIQKKLMCFFKDVLVTSKVYIYIYILAGVICVTNEAAEVGRDDTGSSLTLAFNTLKNT